MAQLEIRDFGPIGRANLDLSPLTVLIGANSSGKSILATIIYAAMHANQGNAVLYSFAPPPPYGQSRKGTPGDFSWSSYEAGQAELNSEVLNLIDSPKKVTASRVSPQVDEFCQDLMKTGLTRYGDAFLLELERCFGEKAPRMVRTGSSRAQIEVSSRRPKWTVRLHLGPRRASRVEVVTVPQSAALLEMLRRVYTQDDSAVKIMHADLPNQFSSFQIAILVLMTCFAELANAHYLPAGRSGILESHKALASFVMKRAPLAGIEDMAIPRMSGVITDFIGALLQMEARKKGPFDRQADELETRLLGGAIRLRSTNSNTYPEISYEEPAGKFSLHRTSSMVSEIAPVVLYLRNILRPHEILIIEEPESHLHPRSQVILAEVITKLVNHELSIVLTTHSDFFLSQINNSIMQHAAMEAHPSKTNEDESLDGELVGAYLLKRGQKAGTRVVQLPVSRSEGIPEDDFVSVALEMYERTVQLDEAIWEAESRDS